MTSQKIFMITLFLIFTACKQEPATIKDGGFYYHHIYFGKNISKNTQQGIQDGCQTAQGNYTKSHLLFNANKNYQEAWFIGRNRCNNTIE